MQAVRSSLLLTALLLISFIAMSQSPFNYDAAWKKVETAFSQGQPKTAAEEVEKIYTQAKREKNEAQQVKAIVYKSQAIEQVEEDSRMKNIQAFEKEIKMAAEPVKQILYSLTADLYKQYFENQRWKIYDRTATNDTDPANPETWSITDFAKRISDYYEKSLSNPTLLQKTQLDTYDPIITKGNMRHLRPTLYDLLAHKAMYYWANDEAEITKPAYAFELRDYASLAVSKIFIRYQFETKDTLSHTYKAITLYQDLVRFHLQDEKPDALIDVDVARVKFAYENSVIPEKKQLYKEALEHIYTQYGKNEQAMQAGYHLALWWQEKAQQYNRSTGTEEDRMAYGIALGYAEKVYKAFPKSEGGIAAKQLVDGIKKPGIEIAVEKVNFINKPFRAKLSFKTLSKVYLRLVKLPSDLNDDERYYENENAWWSRVTGLPAIREWEQKVPEQKDYRLHSAEIKVDGLPYGKYMLLASGDANFTIGKNELAAAVLYVSNISYVNSNADYFVLHRENGQPLEAAKVQVWYSRYDYNSRRNMMEKGELVSTDKNGYLKLSPRIGQDRYNGETKLEITTKNDYLFLDDAIQRVYNGNLQPEKSVETFEAERARYYFFTDRSIYRPGQTLYFKAIGLTTDFAKGKPKLYKPTSVVITLRNANYEEVARQTLKPNEYANISGTFALPASGLTGEFQLEIKQGNQSWQQMVKVEEYKRPQFYVGYEPVKGLYKLNQEVKVTGTAKGYAGNLIDGAQVVYRVHRTTRFLYPWRFGYNRGGYWPMPQGDDMEIANGTTLTKADGTFDVSFTALPDLSIDKKLDPSFTYTIEAVVTDINGETRSEETTISIGYKSLVLNMNTGAGLLQPADSTIRININTTNLNGTPESVPVHIKVIALQSPGKLIRDRYWEAPDSSVMTRMEFEKLFPNDPYKNEDDYRNWKMGKTVLSSTINTGDTTLLTLKPNTLSPGYYRLEATSTDKEGQDVMAVEYLAIFNSNKSELPADAYWQNYTQQSTVEPGQQAIYWQGTSLPSAYIIQETLKKKHDVKNDGWGNNESKFEFINVKKGIQRYRFDASEEDRGGYAVNRVMVFNNRVFTQNWMVNVPWSNKELNISFETFRDKLKPGDNETWKVKISGAKGEQAAAELLAGMYDVSLDQFEPHQWNAVNPWKNNYFNDSWNGRANFTMDEGRKWWWQEKEDFFVKNYDYLISIGYGRQVYRMKNARAPEGQALMDGGIVDDVSMSKSSNMEMAAAPPPTSQLAGVVAGIKVTEEKEAPEKNKGVEDSQIQIRKNFNETALFFPDLKTDSEGNISFSFTMPEALTKWKLQLLGHTTDARFAYATRNVVTQKQLMVMPNAPRFFRQGDNMELSVKVSNLTDKELTGQAQLQLINANTMQPVDGWFKNVFPNQYFTVAAGQSTAVKFPMEIPYLYNDALMYRVIAKAGDVSDGEEMALPVLTNRMLVTESFPLNLRGTHEKTFTWKRFIDITAGGDKTESLDNHSMTVEYTTNPAWYAIQALPYMMEYPYDCAEQTWNRFYANALAGSIAISSPKIKAVFESWKNVSPDALLSNLQKNQELKSALLEETPWVLDAKNEAEQKRNIGLLFDMVRMNKESANALNKLKELQSANGGFVWFKGGRDDRYMTQYILTGIGHLKKLNAWPEKQTQMLKSLTAKAIVYADARIKDEYDELMKQKTGLDKNYLSSYAIQYLYMRSFFPEQPIAEASKKAVTYFTGQAKANWVKQGKYEQGMLALALYRNNDNITPKAILNSLTENSINNEEFGMYWKEFNNPGYYWWQAPIESHALLIEAYSEIENNAQRIDDLKTWLLKQKQTTNWKTTKATAEACYALLLQGTDWLSEERIVNIDLGNYKISSADVKADAGTGYFKQVISKEKITPAMGNIKVQMQPVTQKNSEVKSSTSWGAIYWQYFEDLDRITSAETGVAIKKELYIQRNSDRGPVLEKLKEGQALKVGDRIKVRVEIKNDRNMEYVHLKDMRASCFEPVNVLSSYKYQGGLGYYEATKDASSNFFMGYLPRGTWVFEYELRTTHTGNFSNGITTLQCMYAPEFSSHSKGVRVEVE